MADHPTDGAQLDAFQLSPHPNGAGSATGFRFWAPFALVSMTAFIVLTQVAAT